MQRGLVGSEMCIRDRYMGNKQIGKNEMIPFIIEAPQPLLPPGKYALEEQKPLWMMKKVSLERCGLGTDKIRSTARKANDLAAIYEESMVSEKIPIRYTKKVADSRYERRVIYLSLIHI
eukprot:TRINITY_DN25657_c0_g1_i2.p2 TRINITY_DN25657_c0_g1~~TRINITY_DN25657_c0_g1_i2.p2  ORF type:complete len:119 (-),score=31.12 TRINITY_DN25657_c0_g1_i2:145-501(-)